VCSATFTVRPIDCDKNPAAFAVQAFERGTVLVERAVEYARKRRIFARRIVIERLERECTSTEPSKKLSSDRSVAWRDVVSMA
jgi:hypothetical protein